MFGKSVFCTAAESACLPPAVFRLCYLQFPPVAGHVIVKIRSILAVLPLVFASTASMAQQVYRWVDANGTVQYTDQPPPSTAKNIQQKKIQTGSSEDEDLPYATRQAAKNFPVTLYTGDCGETCIKAKDLLVKRGIPFSEKDPREPTEEETLKKLTGGVVGVPVLKIGNTVLRGFEENQWRSELDIAGYPRTTPPLRPRSPEAIKAPAVTVAPEVLKNFPVTLYNSDCGSLCDRAHNLLQARGIPFTERNARLPAELEELQKLIGPDSHVVIPLLAVGDRVLGGFDTVRWSNALDSAGYPKIP